jgi:hypothetical protein
MSVSLDSVHQQLVKLQLADTVLTAMIAHQEAVSLAFALVLEVSMSVDSATSTRTALLLASVLLDSVPQVQVVSYLVDIVQAMETVSLEAAVADSAPVLLYSQSEQHVEVTLLAHLDSVLLDSVQQVQVVC